MALFFIVCLVRRDFTNKSIRLDCGDESEGKVVWSLVSTGATPSLFSSGQIRYLQALKHSPVSSKTSCKRIVPTLLVVCFSYLC